MPELYIPPTEIFFKLLSYSSNHVLFSRDSDPTFGHYEGPDSRDQWWSLIPGTGKHAGCYAIKSKYTDKFLFSRHMEPRVGHIDSDGKYDDNWFRLERGTGKLANHFRLRNFSSDMVIVSRTHVEPHLTNYSGTAKSHDDHYFSFVFEDTEIVRIKYNDEEGRILSSTPEVLNTVKRNNNTPSPNTVKVTFSETQTITSNFEYAAGFKATVEASGEVGIPFVAEGKVRVELSTSHDFKWGSSVGETKTFETEFSAIVEPYSSIVATYRATKSNITMPFTVYSKSVETGYEVATEGVYRGVTYWDITSDVDTKELVR